MGTSLGGLHALEEICSRLPEGFPLPVAIVQHRDKHSDDALREFLQGRSALPVVEVEDKEPIMAGRMYLAPPDYHLLVDQACFALSTEAPVCEARPSVDVLFESAADAYGSGVIGVVLSGANSDGAQGAARIKERGGLVVAQDPATAESSVMPVAALAATRVDNVLPLSGIAAFLVEICKSQAG
jgi:two-component system chemotaxis response regulator CheB